MSNVQASRYVERAYQAYREGLIHLDQFASLITAIQVHAAKVAEIERWTAEREAELRDSQEDLENLMARWGSKL